MFWCGGYASFGVAVLVCCALSNYHSVTTHTWRFNNTLLPGESYAVLYAERIGVYECTMTSSVESHRVVRTHKFEVLGKELFSVGMFCIVKP